MSDEYALLEWLWDLEDITLYLADGGTETRRGSYGEVAALLAELSAAGWGVATSVAQANWILWTLRRGAVQP